MRRSALTTLTGLELFTFTSGGPASGLMGPSATAGLPTHHIYIILRLDPGRMLASKLALQVRSAPRQQWHRHGVSRALTHSAPSMHGREPRAHKNASRAAAAGLGEQRARKVTRTMRAPPINHAAACRRDSQKQHRAKLTTFWCTCAALPPAPAPSSASNKVCTINKTTTR